jgi:hypothetical protein
VCVERGWLPGQGDQGGLSTKHTQLSVFQMLRSSTESLGLDSFPSCCFFKRHDVCRLLSQGRHMDCFLHLRHVG